MCESAAVNYDMQEEMIAELEQEGAELRRPGQQTAPAAEQLTEQVQADVSSPSPQAFAAILHLQSCCLWQYACFTCCTSDPTSCTLLSRFLTQAGIPYTPATLIACWLTCASLVAVSYSQSMRLDYAVVLPSLSACDVFRTAGRNRGSA